MLETQEATYMDWLLLPEDCQPRFELLNGRLVETASPTLTHQRILRRLIAKLEAFLAIYQLGEVLFAPLDVFIELNQIVVPDVVFVSTERLPLLTERGVVGAPDMVVEILSPSTRIRDLTEKVVLYQRNFVQTYWIIDPEAQEVLVFELGNTSPEKYVLGQSLTTPCLPNLRLEVAALFG